jgi:hypothetical protein
LFICTTFEAILGYLKDIGILWGLVPQYRNISISPKYGFNLFIILNNLKFNSIMDLMSLLKDQLTPEMIAQLSQQTGAAPAQTATAAEGIFSTLLGGLAKNAAGGGAEAILGALNKDQHGSAMGDIMGLLGGAMGGGGAATNGAGILGHILGGQQQGAAQVISQASGVQQSGVADMMMKLAPMVMGVLGQQQQQQQQQGAGFDASSLMSMLGGAVQTQNSNPMMQLATQFLDKDHDGSVVDDLMGMVGSRLLGGMFGKR